MIDADHRLRVARGIAKSEKQASYQVFKTLQRRGHPHAPPATISDGWGGIEEAMLEFYGQVPPYIGHGRPITTRRPLNDWKYIKMVKLTDQDRRFLGVDIQVIYGDPVETLALLGKSTAYIERTHLTMRHFNSRLNRKTLAFSKSLTMHKAAAAWEDLYYNLAKPHKSLRQKATENSRRRWIKRTPAMAAGLAEHIWTVKDLLYFIPLPSGNS